ncbi:hypothetical protein HYU11_02300 [Candidatus Woesearchaeota archaeon]|nr:hypothetical protein [Candidatus Woesearchaeota archaeon]
MAGRVVADAIIKATEHASDPVRSAVGIGGPHYCPNFMKILKRDDICVGHVCPKHMLHCLDEGMLFQALERSVPKAETVILDWKGLGPYKDSIKKCLTERSIHLMKTSDF